MADFDFSGYVQGRMTGLLFNRQKASGPLNDLSNPSLAGGEAETQALLKRLEFSLATTLPWSGWSLAATASVKVPETALLDGWLAYQPLTAVRLRLGRFRVPFGIDPQTSSRKLDTVERPLVYGFGNFGWASGLGLNLVNEREYGVRADVSWSEGFGGFTPSLAVAWVPGEGPYVKPSAPGQIMARVAVSNRLELGSFRHEFTLGLSGDFGENQLKTLPKHYLPIGAAGDLLNDPSAVLASSSLPDRGGISALGADLLLRMNEIKITTEIVGRRLAGYVAQGYVVTGVWEGCGFSWPVDAVARWEEAKAQYADGLHEPQAPYRAATLGATWALAPAWRLQADYIALLLEDRQHAFPGADLFIVQLQWNF